MKPRLVVVYLVVVLTPLVLLTALGVRTASYERDRARRNLEGVLLQSLDDVDGEIGVFVRDRERRLLEITDRATTSTSALRAVARSEPWIRQMVLLSGEGQVLYPSPDATLSDAEWRFLDRARDVLNGGDLLAPTATEGGKSVESHGWHTWYWGKGINYVFWRRTTSGDILGADVDPVRLLADLIAVLPDTGIREAAGARKEGRMEPARWGATADEGTGRCVRLVDMEGATLYQWGSYDPPPEERPLAARRLSPPLDAWSLEYSIPVDRLNSLSGGGLVFSLVVGGLALVLALGGLAVYFYRENTRELREAARRVSFVNQVSHELKTPLTNIRMYAELLEERVPVDDEKGRRHLGVIRDESRRLSRLIANVLTFGRRARDGVRLHPQAGVVDEAIAATIETFRATLEDAGVRIEFRAGAAGKVLFDRDALDQILGNLFSNVEKYAAGGGTLMVESRGAGGGGGVWGGAGAARPVGESDSVTVITVSDRGPGISREHRRRVFEPFYRVSNRLTDGVTGTGIGLSIARDLARLHGGDLALVDSAEGAAFRLTLATPEVDESPAGEPT